MEMLESAQAPVTVDAETTAVAGAAQDAMMEKDTNLSKEELLARLKALTVSADDVSAEEVARIKQQFYAQHNDEMRKAKAAFVEEGNSPDDFIAPDDDVEIAFKQTLSEIKDKKAEQRARIEAEQAMNLERKQAIIAEIAAASEDADNVNRHYQRVKELQAEFKEVGDVPPQNNTALWKSYQDIVERFYDQWKVNKELRDYDFKKNLGEKQLLLAEAEKLVEEPDVITAFRRLQELHDKWRDIGPVAKEVREEIWGKFKDASAEVNKRYQAHFEERKKRERENEDAKTAICERIEALDFTAPATFAAWDEMTKTIIAAQEEWKTLGYASRKVNNELFARFRGCVTISSVAKRSFSSAPKRRWQRT